MNTIRPLFGRRNVCFPDDGRHRVSMSRHMSARRNQIAWQRLCPGADSPGEDKTTAAVFKELGAGADCAVGWSGDRPVCRYSMAWAVSMSRQRNRKSRRQKTFARISDHCPRIIVSHSKVFLRRWRRISVFQTLVGLFVALLKRLHWPPESNPAARVAVEHSTTELPMLLYTCFGD